MQFAVIYSPHFSHVARKKLAFFLIKMVRNWLNALQQHFTQHKDIIPLVLTSSIIRKNNSYRLQV